MHTRARLVERRQQPEHERADPDGENRRGDRAGRPLDLLEPTGCDDIAHLAALT
jgi:hypothetical protein